MELQRTVAEFVAEHGLESDTAHRLLDLVSEVGELAKEALKSSAYGGRPFEPTPAWTEELGDVFFALLCLANTTSVDVERALAQALDKYRDRVSASRSVGSGS